MSIESVSLSQLVSDIKITLQSRYEQPVWVVAEISDFNLNRSGHCYMELVEKDSISDKIIAKTRAIIWSFAFRTLKAYFETTTGETLRSGLKVLVRASIEFHEVFGFSLNIQDIDPQYTLGDMARKKAKIIQQLDKDGVLDMNKGLPFPLVPQRIAVISSDTAAGFGDFTNQLANNKVGYAINTELFPAVMQGDKAAESIINALEVIYNQIDDFDVVAIIRGGGSKSDLSCFDDYELAYFITQFPLPVLTGIGHERDDTITDLVAHTKLKTPTALAEFLIETFGQFDMQLDSYEDIVSDLALNVLENNDYKLEKFTQRLQLGSLELIRNNQEYLIWANSKIINGVQLYRSNKSSQLDNLKHNFTIITRGYFHQEQKLCEIRQERLGRWLNNYFSRKDRRLNFLSEKVELVNPERILERGYAWVTHNGNIVKDSSVLKKGDAVEVKVAKGNFASEVISTLKEK
ncbi:MAG: exodeoxyribonuclease VII large subunit [Salinivirgaceae bacterium]|jgi:exodeoxyribonuclease VII large subunit|nr:exodeoxyribonuclease VII large subunit [Salinivirgaceae bacterium]